MGEIDNLDDNEWHRRDMINWMRHSTAHALNFMDEFYHINETF
jgi:hypothetical protein